MKSSFLQGILWLARNANIQFEWQGVIELEPSREKYPEILRMVQVLDEENRFIWNFSLTICLGQQLLFPNFTKKRWSIESFFKEIKKYLKIKSFLSTSLYVVPIQTWPALIMILLLKALQKQAKHPWHLSKLIAFIRINLIVKINLNDWLNKPFIEDKPGLEIHQLHLF